jgi:glucokinase
MTDAIQESSAPISSLAGQGCVAAVDLGGTKILASIVAPDGRIVARAKKKSGAKGRDPGPVIDRIADCVREAAQAAGIGIDRIGAIGIGAPGPVSHETGIISVAVNLGWHDVPLRAELERRSGRPVAVENDVRLAVLAEHVAGAGRGAENLIGVWPGTGIGGGVIIGGKIVTGVSNSAGEIGHMTVKAGGAVCACGARGHLEALASRTAIIRWMAKRVEGGESTVLTELVGADLTRATSGDLAEALRRGDKLTTSAIERSAKYLAIGIASLANVLNPEVAVLGGGLVEALGEPFVEQISRQLKGRPMLASTDAIRIVRSALGDDAGIVGAAFIARRLADQLISQNGTSPITDDSASTGANESVDQPATKSKRSAHD